MPTRRTRTHAMAYVTAPDRTSARRIARAVLEARLAACANLSSLESHFWWKGSLEQSPEVLVVFKTRRALVPRLMKAVRNVHPYEVACIVSYAMDDGYRPYLAWIDRETAAHR